ncbi:high affinity cAMP-specific and IBMX-insensitive 3',5'-cyclic phosphodiesterase 8-like [Daktulosphaira vitifoliae]|uniref:high affinity cAMP-specific and IBMX-insensitive 3',5'-cyclic phosphodiesterase 8-like n=1 Tax=Daktulosphaira vitifoliae TaxID=58002 RepID=UPI0021AA1747|nr:high affinity cAMP-specific and IBMX-insensitive 3',5'-cyclic phosphodiesterase 8-like [Daktulosphaira vitifoliae]XP_050527678.1 high affinity cAMP-specific and IBMX-insensitive 3',5'-cyclic phosphodiesterase 8-like [Daktulosphaira vitifoliae]XP_050527686.1 high affinity cAMP-specific and IBMX-insensitive 3',5'-cyclic phosphodiesterase 8-like [Daktulosphaira vitifoliae]
MGCASKGQDVFNHCYYVAEENNIVSSDYLLQDCRPDTNERNKRLPERNSGLLVARLLSISSDMWDNCCCRRRDSLVETSRDLGDVYSPINRSESPLAQSPENCNRFVFGCFLNIQDARLNFTFKKILIVASKDDTVWQTLDTTAIHLGWIIDRVTSSDEALQIFHKGNEVPIVVFVDCRCQNDKLIDGYHMAKSLRSNKRNSYVVLVALVRKSFVEKNESDVTLLLTSGFNKIMIESCNKNTWIKELNQLERDDVAVRSVLAQQDAILAAMDKTKDIVIITDLKHNIQYMNKSGSSIMGYNTEDVLNKPLALFHQLGDIDQITKKLEKNIEWDGKVSWKCKNGEHVYLQCRAFPFKALGKETTNYIYVQETTSDNHGYPRGSVPSIRKGSYDLKSINSDGAQSARRQSLAKLHNLPLEAPITKVISLICTAQENSNDQVVQILDKVVDILRVTELYSSHLKTENIKYDDPVTSDLIGALITQSHMHVTSTRRSSNDSATVKSQQYGLSLAKTNFMLSVTPQIKELLDMSLYWDFNIFKLEELTMKRPLVHLGMNLLTHFEVHKTLGCDERVLHGWLTVVEGHYHSKNSYHNSTHAADVLQATAMFLEKDRIKRLLDQLDEACCLIAAITHDIDHPGKSSAFLCNSQNDLALLYNDISVLESHHAALTFKLTIKDDRVNIFKGLEKDTYKVVRQNIIDMILATEMTKHFEHLAKFVSVCNKPTQQDDVPADGLTPSEVGPEIIQPTSAEEVNLVKRMLIKCADVSNPTRPLKLCVEWAKRIAEEYFNQTDEEKINHLPVVMPMFDRATCSIPKSQIGFMDYIINDMFETWDAFIDMPEMLYYMRTNYQYWKDLEEKGTISTSDNCKTSLTYSTLPKIPESNGNN